MRPRQHTAGRGFSIKASMPNTKLTIRLFDYRGQRWAIWLSRLGLYALLALCIWLSKGSTWWTLVTSVLFLLTVILTMIGMTTKAKSDFHGLDELQAWVDRQRAIEAIDKARS